MEKRKGRHLRSLPCRTEILNESATGKERDPMSKTKSQMYRFNNVSRAYLYDTEGFYEHELMTDIRNSDALHDIFRRLPKTEDF